MNSNVPPTRETYTNVAHDVEVDAGWSGKLRIVLGRGLTHERFVYVDSELLGPRRLVLTPAEAEEVAAALAAASGALPEPAEATSPGRGQADIAAPRDRGAIAEARVERLSAVERTLKTEGAPAGRPGPAPRTQEVRRTMTPSSPDREHLNAPLAEQHLARDLLEAAEFVRTEAST